MSATTEEEAAAGAYDRLRELKAFDDTKAGVKGLVDAGVTTVPAIFHHHHEVPSSTTATAAAGAITIPVIDLSADADARTRGELIAQVNAAASTAGFFHLVNHGVPGELLAETLSSVRRFHESPAAAKRRYYTRDPRRRLRFNSNFDLFRSPAANWRDTLFLEAAPGPAPPPEALPPAVRRALPEYAAAAAAVAARVLALLSEALGLPPGRLAGDGCADGLSVVCNYYPPCPEPERTLGCTAHSDPSFLTVLLQDGEGGLQARIGGGWVDVAPVAGGLVVNVGDLLQLVSNGRFRSVEHRVVANRSPDTARVSVACFCNADIARSTRLYGPIAELVSGGDGERTMYRSVTVPEFLAYYDEKGLDGRPALEHFRVH